MLAILVLAGTRLRERSAKRFRRQIFPPLPLGQDLHRR